MSERSDRTILRDLACQYAEAAAAPVQEERRRLWRDHNSLRPTRVPIKITFGPWDAWCGEMFALKRMRCTDELLRQWERALRIMLFHASLDDDTVMEPWITLPAVKPRRWGNVWGVEETHSDAAAGGSWQFRPPVSQWADVARLSAPAHVIDEEATAAQAGRLREAIGDILTVNVDRGPLCQGFLGDLAFSLAQLRGLEPMMLDMYEHPEELHALLAFLRDGVLANLAAAEAAGDLGATSQQNQCMTYADRTLAPAANDNGHRRGQLWGFMAAQEFELVSPEMHEAFLLQYQRPILETWGLTAYGCCENLERKIDMLRTVRNLRIIAVAPRADVRRCAEQIGTDYVLSWRPNPADMVCCGYDEARIRRIIADGLDAARGCRVHIHLKDIHTLQGDADRLARWVRLVRQVLDGPHAG
ncbi:MAG: hypothetical protein GX591_10355 [Planctomycetes bacterium]|nr:hypothetical protein [Planctomycetota bacterium]